MKTGQNATVCHSPAILVKLQGHMASLQRPELKEEQHVEHYEEYEQRRHDTHCRGDVRVPPR